MGSGENDGGFYWMENKGGDPLSASNWKHEIDQWAGAWGLDFNGPKDLSGNGNADDIAVGAKHGARNSKGVGLVAYYSPPSDPTDPWTRTVIDSGPSANVNHLLTGKLAQGNHERDIIASGSSGATIYAHDDDYSEWQHIDISAVRMVFPKDINNDGRDEIVLDNKNNLEIQTWTYDSDSDEYTEEVSSSLRKPDDRPAFADIDRDGNEYEIFVGNDNPSTGGLRWYRVYEDKSKESEGTVIIVE